MPLAAAGRKRAKSRRHGARRRAQDRRSRLAKLLLAAITPKRADDRDRVPACRDDVMPAIAPHAAIAGVERPALENMADQIALVLMAPVELSPIDSLEITLKIEMTQDALRVDDR